jgi:NTP pyrophosphatase (non-canonical NTP hydrolase)
MIEVPSAFWREKAMHEKETFSVLSTKARDLVQRLDWQTYHTPENLTLFLLGEASELGEYCQWLSKEEMKQGDLFDAVCQEIADVVKNVLYMVNVLPLEVSLERLLLRKIELDAARYPIQEFKSKSRYQVATKGYRSGSIEEIPRDELQDKPAIREIQQIAWKFVEDRDWQRFHSPACLALAIAAKSGEVATSYQRRPEPIQSPYERVIWSLADILLNALRFCEFMEIYELFQIVEAKLESDENRFQQTNRFWRPVLLQSKADHYEM